MTSMIKTNVFFDFTDFQVVQRIRREIAAVAVLQGDALAVRLAGIDGMLQEGQQTVQESKEQRSYFRQVLGEGGVMNHMDLVHMFDGKNGRLWSVVVGWDGLRWVEMFVLGCFGRH